jgi:translation initiation factor 3 subunit E
MYDEKDVLSARLDILKGLGDAEEFSRVYSLVNGSPPASAEDECLHNKLLADHAKYSMASGAILKIIEGEGAAEKSDVDNFAEANSAGVFTAASLEALYNLSMTLFRLGHVDGLDRVASYLFTFLEAGRAADESKATSSISATVQRLALQASWGKCACEILTSNLSDAKKEAEFVQSLLSKDASGVSPAVQLQHWSWLLHWSLFWLMKPNDKGSIDANLTEISKWPLDEKTSTPIALCCPWLLRYVAFASIVMLEPSTMSMLRQLNRLVTENGIESTDPLVRLVVALLETYDFDEAQEALSECEAAMRSDFFLGHLIDDVEGNISKFMSKARKHLFETYCRLHGSISIELLAKQLGLSGEDAEDWVVSMVRGAQLDARVDTATGQVQLRLDKLRQSPAQMVLSKTADLVVRSNVLKREIDGMVSSQRREADGGSARGAASGAGGYAGRH